ncbi:MAG: glycerol-3-phosphate 1-O-acyltransferase PlsY [Oscillospiraceae bacterium]|nr:glycerol-3-phosphate 1-O-acyltransferase PlsY [Oscillospiraceae bacterium]
MILTIFITTAVIAYLLGSVNSSIIMSKLVFHADIRNSGSGNAGATNMLRTYGKKAGVFTLVGDMLKGLIAVLIGVLAERIIFWHTDPQSVYETGLSTLQFAFVFGKPQNNAILKYLVPAIPYAAGFFVMVGHIFPVFFKFRGGKGVATAAAVILSFDWRIGVAVISAALIVMAVSKYVSLGSVIGAAAYPLITLGVLISSYSYKNLLHFVFALLIAALCIIKHISNIKRLMRGEENKLGKHE